MAAASVGGRSALSTASTEPNGSPVASIDVKCDAAESMPKPSAGDLFTDKLRIVKFLDEGELFPKLKMAAPTVRW